MSREFFDETLEPDGDRPEDLHGLERLAESERAHAEDLARISVDDDAEDEAAA
jgi:hypothetical protein